MEPASRSASLGPLAALLPEVFRDLDARFWGGWVSSSSCLTALGEESSCSLRFRFAGVLAVDSAFGAAFLAFETGCFGSALILAGPTELLDLVVGIFAERKILALARATRGSIWINFLVMPTNQMQQYKYLQLFHCQSLEHMRDCNMGLQCRTNVKF